MFLWILILIISLVVLVKSSDFFTDAAEKLGIFLGIPQFIVGVTFVAIGTSLPELISSLIAISKGSSEIVVANVIGSNITNIFLVLGFAAIISKKISLEHDILKIDLPLMLGSAFLLGIQIYDGEYTKFEAILSILCMASYFAYTLYHKHDEIVHPKIKKASIKKKSTVSKNKNKTAVKKTVKKTEKKSTKKSNKTIISNTSKARKTSKESGKKVKKEKVLLFNIMILAVSGFFIYLGAEFTIQAVIAISKLIGIGTEIIAVSAIALGTSLPELAVSISAAKKGNTGIIAGNILGSNIFNATLVMGVPGLVTNLIIPQNIIEFSLPLMIVATVLFFVTTQDREITLWEGLSFIIFYIFFIGSLFIKFL